MALPSSGEIKASQINTEAGRSSNAEAPLSGSSSTPQAGSLVKLYENAGVDQSAPHSYSEFYGAAFAVEMPGVYQGETGRDPVFVEYTYYLDPSEAATTQDINNGDTIYTDSALTTPVGEWDGYTPYRRYDFTAAAGAAIGGTDCSFPELPVSFQTNSSGQIINIECAQP